MRCLWITSWWCIYIVRNLSARGYFAHLFDKSFEANGWTIFFFFWDSAAQTAHDCLFDFVFVCLFDFCTDAVLCFWTDSLSGTADDFYWTDSSSRWNGWQFFWTDSSSRSNGWQFFWTDCSSRSNGWRLFWTDSLSRSNGIPSRSNGWWTAYERLSVSKRLAVRNVFAWEVTYCRIIPKTKSRGLFDNIHWGRGE